MSDMHGASRSLSRRIFLYELAAAGAASGVIARRAAALTGLLRPVARYAQPGQLRGENGLVAAHELAVAARRVAPTQLRPGLRPGRA